MIITGKSERYSRYLIQRIKKYFNKEDHQVVSISEFCSYMGLEQSAVEAVIIQWNLLLFACAIVILEQQRSLNRYNQ